MKKIFISLAAIAALVSCVEEKGLEPQPQHPVGNQVTITAVAAETKTALAADGTSIVWENGDEISLIFDYGEYKSSVICTTELATPNSTAEFTGDLTDIESAKVAENVNLLYPADAFDNPQITFKVPAEQDGTVGSGENLSYALLTKTEIAGGTAVAQFTNALSLFKITVPAGVKTVTLTANRNLSGTGTYKFNEAGELVLNSIDQGSSNNTVVLNSESGLDAARTYDVLVYPGDVTSLTLELTGVDGASYSKTLKHDDNSVYMTLEAGEYYNLKMANIFQWNTETALSASPLGGELEIKTSTTADFDYDVTINNADGTGTPDWISTTPLAKGFHQDVIVLYVDQNISGNTREAKVTVSYGDEKSQVFTVTQSSAFMDFVYTEENPIEWEETFGFYESEANVAANNAFASYTNVFRISIAEGAELTYGTYKIENMFKAGFYYYEGQLMKDKGGVYYAEYDEDKNELVVSMNGATKSYDNISDVTLVYDKSNKIFTTGTFAANTRINNGASVKSGFIGNYEAHVYVPEEPETPGDDSADPIAGTWDVTCELGDIYGMSAPVSTTGVMIISGSAGSYVIESIAGANYGLSVTFDGTTLTGGKNGATLTFIYDADAKTLTFTGTYQDYENKIVKNINATKQAGTEEPSEELIAGTWDVTCELGDIYGMSAPVSTTGVMIISGSAGSYVIESIAGANYGLSVTFDGTTLTGGKNGATLTFIYDADAKTLTFTGTYQDYENKIVKNIIATNRNI